nr:M3 family oligoendopeptidase [Clostridia bacterium]
MKFSEYKYERPNLEEIDKQFKDLFTKLENARTKEETFDLIEKTNKLSEKITANIEICYIRNSIDTTDEFYEKEQAFLDENVPKLEIYVTQYAKILLQSKFRKEIDEKYGKAWLELKEMSIKAFDEKIIPELQEEAKLQTKYSKLLASAKIEFDGKINNLTQMAAYAENKDRVIRKAAYLKKAEFMASIEDQIDEIYDQLVKVRDAMAK